MMRSVTAFDPFCMSSYLALRYVPRAGLSWRPGLVTRLPAVQEKARVGVETADEILAFLSLKLGQLDPATTGLLLSGGIDSAILGALMPRGTRAYTIRFLAPGAVDESPRAAEFAAMKGLVHRVIDVGWQDHLELADALMQHKAAPLHAIEVGLHRAAQAAASDGLTSLVVGNGADTTFGGMDKLLSRDWSFDAFIERYTFADPARLLVEPLSMRAVFDPYRLGDGIDVAGFLKQVHGLGIVQSFENAIESAACQVLAPYEELVLSRPLDLARIRAGDPKYLLTEVFARLFDGLAAPAKIPFARPMDQWLSAWGGPARAEFRSDLALEALSGDQRWLVYCLDRFLTLMDDSAR
jgi:hypothetical protein